MEFFRSRGYSYPRARLNRWDDALPQSLHVTEANKRNKTQFACTLLLVCLGLILWTTYIAAIANRVQRLPVVQVEVGDSPQNLTSNNCETRCRDTSGAGPLPRGFAVRTSDVELRPLWGSQTSKPSKSLLAMTVGIKQKENVNKIVTKFMANNITVMLFHYDGVVDAWSEFEWNSHAVHVSAVSQTKWWFAKRFLHPDIVAEYEYIFLWDEDLGVENFDPGRYISIIKEEQLEISQPALDAKSLWHHPITVRDSNVTVHRRIVRAISVQTECREDSEGPPCTGWVEMMAPVFSRASWRCVWHMIQNDLVHSWGLDYMLGYCAQGDRSKNVGIVDSEYVHHPKEFILGNQVAIVQTNAEASNRTAKDETSTRSSIRYQSSIDMNILFDRWQRSTEEDECWTDPYQR